MAYMALQRIDTGKSRRTNKAFIWGESAARSTAISTRPAAFSRALISG
jgi:hypothetical protein